MRGKGAYLFILFFASINNLVAQQVIQIVRGRIIDKESNKALVGSTVVVYKDSAILSQTVSDVNGEYRIPNVPIGEYTIKASYIGYLTSIVSKVVVNSAKEIIANFQLEESISSMKEVEVHSEQNGKNEWSSGSTKHFSVEETNRYAGSRSDSARMVSNYAGVQGSDDSRNDIVIRGNSPLGMLWRYEGIDVPNPNHFAIIGNTGGPVSILNNKVLDNSEFYTGAFPAEYGNTIAGVFDIKMRNGNNEKHEFTVQYGLLGAEIMAEGPVSKKSGSSFLVAYRYSTLKMLQSLKVPLGTDAIPNYQDLSFKLNFPLKNGGNISIYSIGGFSNVNTIVSTYKDPEKELYVQKDRDQYFSAGMNTTGISYVKPLSNKTYLKIILAYTTSRSRDHDHLVYRDSTFHVDSIVRKLGYKYIEDKLCANLFLNTKLNSHMSFKYGLQVNRYSFNMIDSNYNQLTYKFENQINYKGNAFLAQPYVEYKYKISEDFVFNAGVHGQFLTLNGSSSIEPRGSIRWGFIPGQSISLSAGMHSQMQPTYNYFYHFPSDVTKPRYSIIKNFERSQRELLKSWGRFYFEFFTTNVPGLQRLIFQVQTMTTMPSHNAFIFSNNTVAMVLVAVAPSGLQTQLGLFQQ